MARRLNKRQELFVAEYLTDLNATRSAIAAGYSKRTAEVIGYQLLQKTSVQQEISKQHEKRLGKLEISADRVLQGLAQLAFYDIRKMFDADGRCKPLTELDDDTAVAIAGMKTAHKVVGDEADGMVVFTEYKLADRLRALELCGRHLKLFTDKLEHSGRVSLADLVIGSMEPRKDEPGKS